MNPLQGSPGFPVTTNTLSCPSGMTLNQGLGLCLHPAIQPPPLWPFLTVVVFMFGVIGYSMWYMIREWRRTSIKPQSEWKRGSTALTGPSVSVYTIPAGTRIEIPMIEDVMNKLEQIE